MHGGAADRSGLIHVGDEVIEVNGINVEGKTPNDVLTILVRRIQLGFGFIFQKRNKKKEKKISENVKSREFCVIIFNRLNFKLNSKIQREPLHSNWCHRTERVDNAKVRFEFAHILNTIQRMTRTFHAKRPVWLLRVAKFCISLDR